MKLLVALFALVTFVSAVPLHRGSDEERVPGEYVIVLKDDAEKSSVVEYLMNVVNQGVTVETFQIGTLRGAFATLSPEQLEFHLRQDHVLKFVSENRIVGLGCTSQPAAEWHLERVSERLIDLANPQGYSYTDTAGEGVTSYIIDTGIYTDHNEFATGRASWGTNTIDATNSDCHGHGTHVAGTVAGVTYGVAKKTTVVAVKVLNCQGSGTSQTVIRGVQWVTENAQKPANANMSLGGGNDAGIISAVEASIAQGIVYIVAAGNSNANACNFSPANAPNAITAGATAIEPKPGSPTEEQADVRSTFSNYGECVDIFAPGTLVTSAWIGSTTAIRTISGTSMASPHVAGVVSLVQGENPNSSPAEIQQVINNISTKDVIELNCSNAICNSSPNELVFAECTTRL